MNINQKIINEFSSEQKLPIQHEVQEDCAFEGATRFLVPIADAAHLVHGPSGCVGAFLGQNNLSASYIHKIRFTTDMEESDIIFGGFVFFFLGFPGSEAKADKFTNRAQS
ncbi:nitrogenase MoFe cofactor biosynthesis protein NifE [Calothrix sp. NIES-4071]|nr:nitrogenase MoFe cofactor biosynthesis protein NifE [Calothrix sp. NIES-4071]BAZ55265.1 nitrogenase MoFe cofactor biosynthesis protein NifE [Calothrix sp. NIES-4105]